MMVNTITEETCAMCTLKHAHDQWLQETKHPSDALIQQHLTTYDPISAECTISIRQALDSSRSALSDFDRKMEVMEAELVAMRSQRPQMERTIFSLDAILHPIRSLPDDILSEIFKWCLPIPLQFTLRDRYSYDPTGPPWTLSQINRRWRAVALSSPRLWSLVLFHVERKPKAIVCRRDRDRLELQLERSRPCDLTIVVSGDYGRHLSDMLQILGREASRWRSFRADVPSDMLVEENLGSSFDHLTSLRLQFQFEEDPASVDVFRNARKLESFEQTGGGDIHVVFPFKSLKSFGLFYSNVALLPRLEEAEALEVIHIEDYSVLSQLLIPASAPLSFPFLRSLEIVVDDHLEGLEGSIELVEAVSKLISAPALISFGLRFLGGKRRAGALPARIEALHILRYTNALTHLVLLHLYEGEEAGSDSIINFLRCTRNLESFTFNCPSRPGENPVLRMLSIEDDAAPDSILLPKLTRLYLHQNIGDRHALDILEIMVSRWMRNVSKDDVAWCTIAAVRWQMAQYVNAWESMKKDVQGPVYNLLDSALLDGRSMFKMIPDNGDI